MPPLSGPRAVRPTVLTSVPPSPLDARPCHALHYHPQHGPCPQRAPGSLLIAGAACVAFSYATTIYCPRRSTHATTGHIPRTTPTSPAPAAAALHRARHVRRLPARPPYPQHHADLRSKPAPARITNTRRTTRTPCTSPAHALRPSSASMTALQQMRPLRMHKFPPAPGAAPAQAWPAPQQHPPQQESAAAAAAAG
jgi:hypothetical protein